MLNLIFFTTNKTKLAHARHMAENYPVSIESFRRKTYYASYVEPRIDSRTELLHQSYESALEQAKNSGINPEKSFFFLEDTSVIIDALSSGTQEVPGVNVKYWMKDTVFKDLDKQLKKASNRNVTVRSDLLLHIPEYYRRKWNIKDHYVVFVGKQEGVVVEAEEEFNTNLVFPWLDNKTFNKWFVPTGESKPISCLGIESANRYDFRLHAFSKMMEFFEQNRMFGESYVQQSLDLDSSSDDLSPILIICGFPCAGKTTLSQYLVHKYGYIHIEASDFMYLNFYLRHDVGSEIKISDFAEEALKQKPEIAAEKIADYISTLDQQPIVISGFRSMDEIDWLKNRFGSANVSRKFKLGFIEASKELRFDRYNKRKRDGHEVEFAQFQLQDDQQVRMGLREISLSAHKVEVINEGTFDEFYNNAQSVLKPSEQTLHDAAIDLSNLRNHKRNIGLEAPILMALLSKWQGGEDHPYFTTTEIAKLINQVFPAMKPKYKDNVSRYFNQDYYAYYEIDPDSDENKRRYRLSNSGYSRAVDIYYDLVHGS